MKSRFTTRQILDVTLRIHRFLGTGRCGRLLVFVGLGGGCPTSGSDSTTFQGTGVGRLGRKDTWGSNVMGDVIFEKVHDTMIQFIDVFFFLVFPLQ